MLVQKGVVNSQRKRILSNKMERHFSIRGPRDIFVATMAWNLPVKQRGLKDANAGTLFIELGSPCENGCIERFKSKLRDYCLNGELFLSLAEVRYVVDHWR